MTDTAPSTAGHEHQGVACLGCPLVCDDLVLQITPDQVVATGKACDKARAMYAGLSDAAGHEAKIGAEAATREAALERAASILGQAELPLIAGLDTDVDGVRAALRLAEHCGGVVDHLDGESFSRSLRVMQTEGWLSTTLGEARNRADLLLIFGILPVTAYPRLLERLTDPKESLSGAIERRRIFLLGPHAEPLPQTLLQYNPRPLRVGRGELGTLAGLLRARLAGTKAPPRGPDGLGTDAVEELVAALSSAEYPVLIWSPGEFDDVHGDLVIQRFVELARELGERTRSTALTLGQSTGAVTAQQVSTWCCGFPTRISFAGPVLDYDPHCHSAERMLARGEADALLWVGCVDEAATSAIPRIVLGRNPPPPLADDVYIRVGVPGLDHAAQLFRFDGVPLRLRKLRESSSPSAAQLLDQIRERCP